MSLAWEGSSSGGLEFNGATIGGAPERGWQGWGSKGEPLTCKHWGPFRPPWDKAELVWAACGGKALGGMRWSVGCSKWDVLIFPTSDAEGAHGGPGVCCKREQRNH